MRKAPSGIRDTSSPLLNSPPLQLVKEGSKSKLPVIPVSPEENLPSHNTGPNDTGLSVAAFSLQGKRPYQEDEYAIRPFLGGGNTPNSDKKQRAAATHFFGLFDGHAGGRCSKHISANLPDVLAEDSLFLTNLPLALKRSFHTTNDVFLKIAEQQRLHDGSTGICSLIRNGKLLVGNVGDCRALLLSGGKPIQMSIDQKPTNPDEIKRIASLGGVITNNLGVARVNGVLAVSRAFGNRKLRKVIRPDIEMMQRELTRDDDFLVMASDGLWDVLRNKDVCDICYSLAPSQRHQQIAEELVHAALARGSMDNVTCVVVKLTGYVSKQLLKENCENRSDNAGLDSLSLVNPNSSKTYFSNAISPSNSPTTVNMMHGQQAQTQEYAPTTAFSAPQMQRSLFTRGNENQSPEHIRNNNTYNITHPRAYTNGVGSAKLGNQPPLLSSSRSENMGNGTSSYPSSSAKNPRNNQGINQGGQGEEMSKGQTLTGALWGMPGVDGSNFVTRPWTGPNPLIGQTTGQPGSGGQGIAMLQGRQSPSQQSVMEKIQSPNTYNPNQYYQHQIGPRCQPNKDDIGFGDKADDIDVQPSSVLMRPHPQRIQQMSVSSRFQQAPSQSNLFSPNHDPRSGFTSVKGANSGIKGGGAFNSNNRAASASSASVRNSQSMPKLPSKTNSFDLLAQQQPSPHSRGVESPYQHSNINFSSIARNGTPPGLAANSSPVAGGIRPLNSPIAFLTAAAERQRSISTSHRTLARPQTGTVANNTNDKQRSVTASSRKVNQMRIAYA
mmetsp:Transcript_26587/g.25453  ORF Transcript_26587/g.25453 Transcript_26587/m.25453 type:complete len:779 (-) Transcript_26587:524-2860(-)|eukprot:CAMPEP_0119046572 /NCGR_PEP_ID=MMETSP1177-20130426/47573_1 /TAXON_ID=2985 /ORGANISM="Ochromonas sp, Strain CCMP1899" /LENGTH=778 /DNA_ID=CAMNT_0007019913 /DNA_START=79 /DNA_END=2415 /DNA_ORIENTATION=+